MEPELSTPNRRLFGGALILAPLLLLASTTAYVVAGEGVNHGVSGGVIGVWSCLAMILAMIGLLRILEPHAPRATPWLLVLAVCGFGGGIAFNLSAVFDAVFEEVHQIAAVDTLWETEPGTFFAYLPWGWFAPLSLLLVGILLWRTHAVPRWNAALLAVSGVTFVASRIERVDPLALASDALLIIALVPLGWALLTGARHRDRVNA
ncbi:hypothetical protein [Nocardioides limicola]|uniref:hypothetical protein n=1 Tax=Nocardioides limicola TaxID=2803368 RepID=UPI00193C7AED|nr:hypothetical protein [Nocardioides sp. DJM-14]